MLYSDLKKNKMMVNNAEKMLENFATKLKQERVNSRALHMQNESFKEMAMKLGVNPEDKTSFEALLEIEI